MAFSASKYIRVPVLEALPSSPDSLKIFNHWEKMLTSFLTAAAASCPGPTSSESSSESSAPAPAVDKLAILCGYISPDVFCFIEHLTTYDDAMKGLSKLYKKKKNVVYSRHLLATSCQDEGETVIDFSQKLLTLSRDCAYSQVTAIEHTEQAVLNAFISGLLSPAIRLRLLENDELTLEKAIQIADSLERAQKFSASYEPTTRTSLSNVSKKPTADSEIPKIAAVNKPSQTHGKLLKHRCRFCGGFHVPQRALCPAKDAECFQCGKKGHFAKVCRSNHPGQTVAAAPESEEPGRLASLLASFPKSLKNSSVTVYICGKEIEALVDSGAYECFMRSDLARLLKLSTSGPVTEVTLASENLTTKVHGTVRSSINVHGRLYKDIEFGVVDKLCADLILGLEFLKLHKNVVFKFDGNHDNLTVNGAHCSVGAAKISKTPEIFKFVDTNVTPVAVKSRNYCADDRLFIKDEISRLLKDGIIEPSVSPWRAQVLVTKDTRHKKRLVIDYSRTINRYTPLDAYPLPRIDYIVNEVAKGTVYSTIDLKSAYHQVPLNPSDRPFTAFEADRSLYQFRRLPFGITNGVAAFQRFIDDFIKQHELTGTIAYLDDVTVYGRDQKEHDKRLLDFMSAAKASNLTINDQKCVFSVSEISLLGHLISHNKIRPDPCHLKPLMDMPAPGDSKSLKRCLGMFAYYSKWIPSFSDKMKPLNQICKFPLEGIQLQALKQLKSDLLRACLHCIHEDEPFEVECDASEVAIAGILSQRGRPVAFMSHTLSKSESNYSAAEREALAIIESVRKWGYLLRRNKFRLITDQKALSFIFRKTHRSKIKNTKLTLWKSELSSFEYDIIHRPGVENVGPDAMSRLCSAIKPGMTLKQVHEALAHPGIRRMYHFIRSKNLPFSMNEVKDLCANCKICAEIKPRFFNQYQQSDFHLIKATRPFERISIDFKGPVDGPRKYILVIIDEYSRFPFAYPCRDMTATTVINCLTDLFSVFGLPEYVHSDRGKSFLSQDLTKFLATKGIASSKSTPYHPTGNAQCERLNQTLWKSIKLLLSTRGLQERQWEAVLPDALHTIRSLLCTATNSTPHDRLFNFARRSMLGPSVPDWLLSGGTVLLRNFVRNKNEPLGVEVELLDANPKYALIRHADGRESTVSTGDLAPYPDDANNQKPITVKPIENSKILSEEARDVSATDIHDKSCQDSPDSPTESENSPSPLDITDVPILRRSTRIKRQPDRYGYN